MRGAAKQQVAMLERLIRSVHKRSTKFPCRQQRPGFDQTRLEELVVRHHEGDTRLLQHLADLGRVFLRRTKRFLTEDRFTRASRRDDGVGVQMVWQTDINDIDRAIEEQRLDPIVDFAILRAVIVEEILRSRRFDISRCHNLAPSRIALPPDSVCTRDSP
jgi:hypothetical protein